MLYEANNIKWDTNGVEANLPTSLSIEVPDHITDGIEVEDYISDDISDQTGWCHKGFDLSPEIEED